MNKKSIYLVIGIITLALLGLILVQIYWVNSAITLREEEFVKDVNKALINVSKKLEAIEYQRKLAAKKEAQQLLQEELIKGLKNNSDTFKTITKNGVQIEMIEHHKSDSLSDQYAKIIKAKSANGQEISLNFDMSSGSFIKRHALGFDSLSTDRGVNASNPLDRILKNLNISFGYESPISSLSSRVLDSLIKAELYNVGIKTNFKYSIYDYYGNSVLPGDPEELYKIRQSGNFVRLFPNNISEPPHFLSIYFPYKKTYLLKTMWILLSSSIILIIAIIWAFIYTIQTIFKQKKLSEIKNDFINNMTHELKTPISTISLACEALSDPDLNTNNEIKSNYLNMINQENKRLGLLVENVLKSALWDSGELELKKEKVNAHEIIDNVLSNFMIKIQKKNGKINKSFDAETPFVYVDKVHFTNVIYNLIDNALKYTLDDPEIDVFTGNEKDYFILKICDNGIGLSKEDQTKIFEKFYRVPTGDIHNVKGFGLGLNYVKALIEKHNGEILVKSDLGKGSCFTIKLPVFNKNENHEK